MSIKAVNLSHSMSISFCEENFLICMLCYCILLNLKLFLLHFSFVFNSSISCVAVAIFMISVLISFRVIFVLSSVTFTGHNYVVHVSVC